MPVISIFVVILAILIFGLLIFIHEFGHYLSARLFHVPIEEFSIGMGPKLLTKISPKTGTAYSIRAFPIGGFVSMKGEDEESEDENALNHKPLWQRCVIVAAGSLTNLIVGILVMAVLVMTARALPSTTILRFAVDGASTEQTGLMVNDTITKVAGKSVHIANDLVYEVMRNAVEPVDVTVLRDGKKVLVEDVVFPTITEKGTLFGTVDFYVSADAKNPGNIFKHAFFRSASTIKMIWESLFDLFTGRYSFDQVSGPIGVTEAIGEAAQESMPDLVYISVVISMNLGIMNLLPLPALDGGRLVFLLIEKVRGKPIKPEYEGYVHFAGIVVLMILMVIIAFKDILNLFG